MKDGSDGTGRACQFEDSPLGQLHTTIHRYFAPHRHSALLAAIVAAFAVRPLIGDTGASAAVFGIALVLLLLVALYNISVDELVGERGRLLAQIRRRRMLGWVLATAAGVERVLVIFVQSPILNLVGTICWLLFVLFVTLSQLRSVLKQREVTGEPSVWRSRSISCSVFAGPSCTRLFFKCIQNPLETSCPQTSAIRASFSTFSRFSATSALPRCPPSDLATSLR